MDANDNVRTKSPGALPWIAAGAFVALLAFNGYLISRVSDIESRMAKQQASTTAEIAAMRDSTSDAAMAMRRSFEELSAQFEDRTKSASTAAQRAAETAKKHADKLVRELAEQQQAHQGEISNELNHVKTAAEQNAEKVTGLETSVGAVKHDVTETRSALEQTVADLKSVRGDLGVQSGMIATNTKELAALRSLGERNYYEFQLSRKTGPMKLGGIVMTLKKADPKRNKFNLDVLADDKRVEKKDKTINEPVQFYVAGARQPYEIVVNEVRKDVVAGYMATPKVLESRR